MKNMFKRNQIMITALAIMIAVAGYLNFAGTTIGEEEMVSAGAQTVQEDAEELSDPLQEDVTADIPSLDSDDEAAAVDNFLDSDMQTADGTEVSIVSEYLTQEQQQADASDAVSQDAQVQDAEVQDGETPGEAVYTSSSGVSTLSGARLLKEQTRAKNKETLLEIINNANIAENQKQEAVDNMIAMTDVAERETAAEILLEAKGFADAVVTISGEGADVVVAMASLTDAQCAQIEDIVSRKAGSPRKIL